MKEKAIDSFQDILNNIQKGDLANVFPLLIHGSDPEEAREMAEQIEQYLLKKLGALETAIYTGEPGDDIIFHKHIFNPPLFPANRLVFFKKTENLKSMYNKTNSGTLRQSWATLPDNTFVVFLYNGEPTKEFMAIFAGRLVELKQKPLYANQVRPEILNSVKQAGLTISDDALAELTEKMPSQAGIIHRTITRFKERFPDARRIELSEIQDILFPGSGMNPFRFIDALFEHDIKQLSVELLNYNHSTDSYFVILKLVLDRLNQIRKYKTGHEQNMKDDEMFNLLALRGSPYFKKRLLGQIKHLSARIDAEMLARLYKSLIELQLEFRSQVPQKQQNLMFDRKVLTEFV